MADSSPPAYKPEWDPNYRPSPSAPTNADDSELQVYPIMLCHVKHRRCFIVCMWSNILDHSYEEWHATILGTVFVIVRQKITFILNETVTIYATKNLMVCTNL